MRNSMRHLESRFNRRYNYPWVFLNDEPFDDEFKKGVRSMTRSEVHFGASSQLSHVEEAFRVELTSVARPQRSSPKSTGPTRPSSTRRTPPRSDKRWSTSTSLCVRLSLSLPRASER